MAVFTGCCPHCGVFLQGRPIDYPSWEAVLVEHEKWIHPDPAERTYAWAKANQD